MCWSKRNGELEKFLCRKEIVLKLRFEEEWKFFRYFVEERVFRESR